MFVTEQECEKGLQKPCHLGEWRLTERKQKISSHMEEWELVCHVALRRSGRKDLKSHAILRGVGTVRIERVTKGTGVKIHNVGSGESAIKLRAKSLFFMFIFKMNYSLIVFLFFFIGTTS